MLDVITEGGRRGRGDGSALAMMSSSCLLGGEWCARMQDFSHGNRANNAANEVLEWINTDMKDKKKRTHTGSCLQKVHRNPLLSDNEGLRRQGWGM